MCADTGRRIEIVQEANCFEVYIHKFCLVAIWQKCNNLSLANSKCKRFALHFFSICCLKIILRSSPLWGLAFYLQIYETV